MRFAYIQFLWLAVVLIPIIAVFLVWSWRRKQKLISQFVASRLLANLTVGVSLTRQKARLVLLGLTAAFALLALARPQWGFDWEEAKVQGLDILVAIDTSKSMLANDVAPTRLARAKMAAFDLLKLAKSDRLGLIAFAGSAFLQTPLTLDEEAFRQNVETLDVGIIPQGGTAVAEAIDTATKAFETSGDNHKVLVLFTDGEDQDTGALEAAEKAAKTGVKIFTIGVGSAEGELIRVPDERGTVGFLKDEQGNVVKSRLNETLLQQIATTGNGFYLPLRGANPMDTLYQRGLAALPKGDSTTKLVKNFRERFHWPLGMAIILLIAEMFLPQRKRVRLDESAKMATNPNLKKAVALFALLLIPASLFSSPSTAIKKYEAGQFDGALTDYQKLLQKKTNDYRLYYNAGDAAYQAKQFDDAKKYFDTAIVSPDLKLQQKAYYNLGNTLYQMGEKAETDKKKEAWEQAVHNYENALKLNDKDVDAKHNLQFVRKMIEELKKQEQQQQKDDKKDKNDKNDQSKDDQQKQQDKKDQKDQKKDQQQAKDQEQKKKDEEKQKDQQKKDQQAKKDEEQKKNEQAQQQKPEKKEGEENPEEQPAEPGRVAKMTPEQAKQFLEAMKQEDRALIFKPPQQEGRAKALKDW
jgi:Ca-activated chloride channel family protein